MESNKTLLFVIGLVGVILVVIGVWLAWNMIP